MADIDKKADRIVKAIKADVTGRRGWRQEWGQFDPKIQKEIIATWKEIVLKALQKP